MKNYLKLYNLETAYSLSGNNFFFPVGIRYWFFSRKFIMIPCNIKECCL